jgi:hypothetical protein
MLRSVLAVVGGFVTMAAGVQLMFLASYISAGASVEPSTLSMAWMLLGGFLAATLGGYVTGFIAGRGPLKHAAALAALCALLSGVCLLLPGPAPFWFQLGNCVVGVAGPLLGGWLRELQVRRRPAA